MPKSAEATSTKCFSAILSRLLCSGGLPTHPSEQLIEPSSVKLEILESGPDENVKRGPTPGVVARLMGLESFPDAPPNKERTLGDFFRSRSVNSIDFLSHFDPIKHGSRRHRRVRTSVSFHEGTDDEYASVVLLFEEELQGKMREKNNGKYVEIQEKRKSVYEKKVGKMSGDGREVSRKIYAGSGFQKKDLERALRPNLKERRPVKKMCEQETLKKRMKKSKILDHKLHRDFNKTHSGCIAPEVGRRASPRKHQPFQNADSSSYGSPSNAAICNNVEVKPIITGQNERKVKSNENCYYSQTVGELGMVDEDVRENWIDYWMEVKFENFEDLCQLLGQEILEGLLRQFVDDLALHCGKEIMISI